MKNHEAMKNSYDTVEIRFCGTVFEICFVVKNNPGNFSDLKNVEKSYPTIWNFIKCNFLVHLVKNKIKEIEISMDQNCYTILKEICV